jgi:hypothetical protein
MSQQSVRQAARRSTLDAQAVLHKERADLSAMLWSGTLSGALGKRCGR